MTTPPKWHQFTVSRTALPEAVRLRNGPDDFELWVVPTSAMEYIAGPSPSFPGQMELVQRLKAVLQFCAGTPTETIAAMLEQKVFLGGLLGSVTEAIQHLPEGRVCPDCHGTIPRQDAYDVLTSAVRIHEGGLEP